MLAIDHGYFQGPTTGLERIDQTILPIVKYADSAHANTGHFAQLDPLVSKHAYGSPGHWGDQYDERGVVQRATRNGH